jgi:hypothetical protein
MKIKNYNKMKKIILLASLLLAAVTTNAQIISLEGN